VSDVRSVARRGEAEFYALIGATLAATVYSWIDCADRVTWLLEAGPVVIGMSILVATRRRFPLTPLVMWLLFGHAVVLLVGAHYTYAQVPVGFWAAQAFELARNHYDRVAHFVQGFVPALLAREILIRCSPLPPGAWLFFLVTCVCLAFSAFYELLEFAAAVIGGGAADAFLGAQGDIWDSHWDMLLALVGALVAQALLGPLHDRALEDVPEARDGRQEHRLY
jgi:putative membrane protein